MSVSALIKEGAAQLSLALSAEQLAQAEGFLALLEKWNQAMNLTGIDDAAQGVGLHLMDSFAIHQHITGASICDLGSGAGVPGIPLAILLPGKDFILLDSNAKKTHFMTQARIELKLNNITVVQDRVETWQGKFDHLVCRAYAHLNKIVSASAHLLAPGGSILAMKGQEAETLDQPGFSLERVHLNVPLIEAERHLCILKAIRA